MDWEKIARPVVVDALRVTLRSRVDSLLTEIGKSPDNPDKYVKDLSKLRAAVEDYIGYLRESLEKIDHLETALSAAPPAEREGS